MDVTRGTIVRSPVHSSWLLVWRGWLRCMHHSMRREVWWLPINITTASPCKWDKIRILFKSSNPTPLRRFFSKVCLKIMYETSKFPEMNNSNPKEFLSGQGYDAPTQLPRAIRYAHIVSHRETRLNWLKSSYWLVNK